MRSSRACSLAAPALAAAALWLSACAHASPVVPAASSKSPFWWPGWGEPVTVVSEVPEGEQFRISHRASTGFVPTSAIRNSARARATEFCEQKGRAMTPVTEQTATPIIVPGSFPRYEIVFVCTEKVRLPDEDPYERLERLKGLLDAGVISQEEFDREKREVLGR